MSSVKEVFSRYINIRIPSVFDAHQSEPNRLKDVASFLGYEFSNKINSGLRSVMFRERWEQARDEHIKHELIRYNKQDCEALRTVHRFMCSANAPVNTEDNMHGKSPEVVFTEALRKASEGNRPVFRKAEFACSEFELINRCAYFDYQRDRLSARPGRLARARKERNACRTIRRRSAATEVLAARPSCPTCGSRRLVSEKQFVRWLIDLKFYKTGIGVKRWQPRYLISKCRCRSCQAIFMIPDVPLLGHGRAVYGHGLMCLCIYHNIYGKQSMLSVHRGLNDIFHLNIAHNILYGFKSGLAAYYRSLADEILSSILRSHVVYIDETPVKLRRTTAYVWVLASPTEVYYMFRDSREGTFMQELLGQYKGVVVSDFFTAYDSLMCSQQKCLIHLIRDINDDLHKNPYDHELRALTDSFAVLLKKIVLTIDRYGLRRRHLHKYERSAARLCAAIAKRPLTSSVALKYQVRFRKYGDRLFTFLKHDGVSWNNNSAEHAVPTLPSCADLQMERLHRVPLSSF